MASSDNLIIQGWFDEELIAAVTGAISGASATTDGADTQSASGSVAGGAITGSAATTDGADTQVASGTLSASATQATTDGADSQSASGVLSTTGTSATTDGADTSTASGSLSATGTAATTDGADTASGSGAISATATSATTDGADTPSASGTVGNAVSGSVAVTDGADTSAASGSVTTAAPTISTPTATSVTSASAVLGATTNQPTGTLYVVAFQASDGVPGSATDVKNGNDGGSQFWPQGIATVSTTTPSATVSGLIPSTAYGYAIAHETAGGLSNMLLVGIGAFTTLSVVTGTLAKTDGADLIAASGAVSATASSSTTDGADTQVASGSVSNDVVGVSSVLDGGDIFIATGDVSGSRGGFYHGELRDFARKTLTKRQIAKQRRALGILAEYPQQAAAEIVKGLMDPDVSSNDLDMMQAEIASQADRLARLMGIVVEHQQFLAALDLQIRVRRDEEAAVMAVIAAYQYQ